MPKNLSSRSFSPVRSAEEDAQAQLRAELLERARALEQGEELQDVAVEATGEHSDGAVPRCEKLRLRR